MAPYITVPPQEDSDWIYARQENNTGLPIQTWTQDSGTGLPELVAPASHPLSAGASRPARWAGRPPTGAATAALPKALLRFRRDVKLYAQLVLHLHCPAANHNGSIPSPSLELDRALIVSFAPERPPYQPSLPCSAQVSVTDQPLPAELDRN